MFHSFWNKFLPASLALAIALIAAISTFAANTKAQESDPAFAWSLAATAPRSRLDEATLLRLEQNGLRIAAAGSDETQQVSLAGDDGLDQLRAVLHLASAQRLNPILSPTKLTLRGEVRQGDRWTLALDSNLTTGYSWELAGAGELVVEEAPDRLETVSSKIGAPLRQTFSFKAIRSGAASIELVYRRPFGPLETPTLVLEVQAPALLLLSDLTDPARMSELEMPLPVDQPASPSSAEDLPAYFSWKDLGKVTPIRDQNPCGSCWAFATVASLETAVYIQDNEYSDLSEQYLVSCNTDGWDCWGGGTAHSYHQDKIPPGEPSAGAVMEENFRYSASDEACNPPHPHAFKISGWQYVTTTTPNTNAIKNAVYTYGAVKASMCAGSAFQNYSGGVFTTNESYLCPLGSHTNHAISIIGWDDSLGAWLIKNSWGNTWGEEGYMRIAYGTSGIGIAASYVVYAGNPLPSRPNLVSPAQGANFNTDEAPVFTWTTANRAVEYYLNVTSDSGYAAGSGWISAVSFPWSTLPAGVYHWNVKGRNSQLQEGDWSETWTFTVANPPPAPELFVPADGQNFSPVHPIALSWTKLGAGITYSVYLCGYSNGDSLGFEWWQSEAFYNIYNRPDACGWDGPITWKVKAKNAAGESPFSETRTLTIGWTLPKTELLSPVNESRLSTALPVQLQWKPVPGAREYFVEHWYGSSTPHESGWITGTTWNIGYLSSLTNHDNSWWVKSRESYEGEGNWSLSWHFYMRDPPPPPTLLSPASGLVMQSGTALDLKWNANAAPVLYHVRLWTEAGDETITPNQAGTTWNTGLLLPGGKYNWQVFAFGNEVDSLPSETRTFRLFGAPLAPEVIYPVTALVPRSFPVRFSWQEDINATEYRLELWKTGQEGAILADSGWVNKLYWLSRPLEPAGYSFRIKSRNPYAESEWSSVYQFTAYEDYLVMLPIAMR